MLLILSETFKFKQERDKFSKKGKGLEIYKEIECRETRNKDIYWGESEKGGETKLIKKEGGEK